MSASLARGFRGRRGGGATLRVSEQERSLLLDLFQQLAALVEPEDQPVESADPLADLVGIGEADSLPSDPALARLFPDAYADLESASDFRRFTEARMRTEKMQRVGLVLQSLRGSGRIDLDVAATDAWLRELTDLRLVLAARLDIKDEEGVEDWETDVRDGEREGAPLAMLHSIYNWLGWLHETLVAALW